MSKKKEVHIGRHAHPKKGSLRRSANMLKGSKIPWWIAQILVKVAQKFWQPPISISCDKVKKLPGIEGVKCFLMIGKISVIPRANIDRYDFKVGGWLLRILLEHFLPINPIGRSVNPAASVK